MQPQNPIIGGSVRQIAYILLLAYERCGMDESELVNYTAKVQLLSIEQAGALISQWTSLPKLRSVPDNLQFIYDATGQRYFVRELLGGKTHQVVAPIKVESTPGVAPQPSAAQKYTIPDKGWFAIEYPVDGVMTRRFYRVTENQGWQRSVGQKNFVRLSGQNVVRIFGNEAFIAATIINSNPSYAMKNYGKQIGRCGACGRRLTDPESIDNGIGPECIKRFTSR